MTTIAKPTHFIVPNCNAAARKGLAHQYNSWVLFRIKQMATSMVRLYLHIWLQGRGATTGSHVSITSAVLDEPAVAINWYGTGTRDVVVGGAV